MNTMKAQTIRNKRQQYRLSQAEMESIVGGKPGYADGIVDFFAWIACGFNHHYVYTGKTQIRTDIVRVTFYEQRCKDCGHINWTRSKP